MIIDHQTRFSNSQSIAAAVGDVVSTDIYDTGTAADRGIGQDLNLQVHLGVGVTSGGAATVQFVLQTAVDAAFTSPLEFPLTPAVALAALTTNSVQYRGRLPMGLRRFVRLVYRIGTAPTTGGAVTAFMAQDLQNSPSAPTTTPGVK